MMRTDFRAAVAASLILSVVLAGHTAAADRSQRSAGILLLRNGSTIEGTFSQSASGDAIAWQATQFTDPFEFVIDGITSINFPAATPRIRMEGEFAIELHSGDLLSGKLTDWSEEVVTLESAHFGRQQIREQSIRRIERIDENPTLVFSGLTGLSDWDHVAGNWQVEGVELKTADPDASLMGDFNIPDRAIVEFQLSWENTPNFSFAIGVDPDARLNTSRGWSFDTWNSQLTLVREREEIAVVEPILKLDSTNKQLRLTVFIDRKKGTILIYRHDGSLPVKASLPPPENDDAKTNSTGIAFVSHFGKTRLKRLRISQWEGALPLDQDAGISRFRLKDGQVVSGKFIGYDRSARTVTVEQNSQSVSFDLAKLVKAEFKESPPAAKQPMIVALQDQSRLSGSLLSIGDQNLKLASPDLLQPVDIDVSLIRSLAVINKGPAAWEVSNDTKSGRLEIGDHQLRGHLVPAEVTGHSSCLAWKPDFSRTASTLLRNAAGRIVYREKKPTPPPQENVPNSRPRTIFGKFGQLFLQNAKNPRQQAAASSGEPHDLHLISGDVLPCLVKSIDEQGLHIEGSSAEVDLIPHAKIKALVLKRGTKLPDLDEEKKSRLLTLPRNQKGSPPTHLLYSDNGDFLRCRLNHFTAEQMRIELHLSEMELPSHRISHIIWLHPEKLLKKEEETPDDLEKPLIAEKPQNSSRLELHEVQVLLNSDNRSTFTPREITEERIVGTSDVIGGCSYDLKMVDQIIFGSHIEVAAKELPYHQWALTPALEPLYLQAANGESSDDGLASAFVGQPAPDFQLKLLDGENFVLSEAKGKIIVLDFWATWCGPCMLTMPLMEKAMEQFPSEKVEMISVNLEERPEQIRDVLKRHQLSPKVALDIDGAVARKYQVDAIPQLFIVDRDGNIARVYIGGGQSVVDQFTASLQELLEPASSEDASGS
jgi:thiol-disulfide isomerase/thioredoxin